MWSKYKTSSLSRASERDILPTCGISNHGWSFTYSDHMYMKICLCARRKRCNSGDMSLLSESYCSKDMLLHYTFTHSTCDYFGTSTRRWSFALLCCDPASCRRSDRRFNGLNSRLKSIPSWSSTLIASTCADIVETRRSLKKRKEIGLEWVSGCESENWRRSCSQDSLRMIWVHLISNTKFWNCAKQINNKYCSFL